MHASLATHSNGMIVDTYCMLDFSIQSDSYTYMYAFAVSGDEMKAADLI